MPSVRKIKTLFDAVITRSSSPCWIRILLHQINNPAEEYIILRILPEIYGTDYAAVMQE